MSCVNLTNVNPMRVACNASAVVLLFSLVMMFWTTAAAATLRLGVASNFLPACKEIAEAFKDQTGHKVTISSASTGKLYAQIVNGAPYDIFLAANEREPKRLEKQGLITMRSRFTYAVGRLALLSSRQASQAGELIQSLKQGDWQRLAIANPRTAPYGQAAKEVLQHLELWDRSKGNLLRGENIGQAFYFTKSGNAELGLVALSQVELLPDKRSVNYKVIPSGWHQPLRQQAVILKRAADQETAKKFMAFLKQAYVKKLLSEKFGYDREEQETGL